MSELSDNEVRFGCDDVYCFFSKVANGMNQQNFGVSLSQPQRVAIAGLLPQLVDRLKHEVRPQVKIEFAVSTMKAIWWSAGEAIPTALPA